MNDAPETAHDAAASDGPQAIDSPRQAKKRRRCFNLTERLAAAYLKLGLVPEPLAKTGSAKDIVRHIQADHNVLHCIGGTTAPQNCNLLPQSVHAEKSRRDTAIAAKIKRIADKEAAFRRKVLAKTIGLQMPAGKLTRKGNLPLPCGKHSEWRKPLGSFISVRREKR